MFFWFIGTAVVTVWFVFRDPAFDFRLLVVGSVLPALVAALFDWAMVFYSVTFSIVLLGALMVATTGRRPARATLLGLPVGTLLHLVYSGSWSDSEVFWWPFLGWSLTDVAHPVAQRGWWVVPLELIGLALCSWVVSEADLRDREPRARFVATGYLALPVR